MASLIADNIIPNNNNIKYDKVMIEEECIALQAIFGDDKCKILKKIPFDNTVDCFLPPRVIIDLVDTWND